MAQEEKFVENTEEYKLLPLEYKEDPQYMREEPQADSGATGYISVPQEELGKTMHTEVPRQDMGRAQQTFYSSQSAPPRDNEVRQQGGRRNNSHSQEQQAGRGNGGGKGFFGKNTGILILLAGMLVLFLAAGPYIRDCMANAQEAIAQQAQKMEQEHKAAEAAREEAKRAEKAAKAAAMEEAKQAAVATLVSYFDNIAANNYGAARDLLTRDKQKKVGLDIDLENKYISVKEIYLAELECVKIEPDKVDIEYFEVRTEGYHHYKHSRHRKATVVKQGETWKIAEMEIDHW